VFCHFHLRFSVCTVGRFFFQVGISFYILKVTKASSQVTDPSLYFGVSPQFFAHLTESAASALFPFAGASLALLKDNRNEVRSFGKLVTDNPISRMTDNFKERTKQ